MEGAARNDLITLVFVDRHKEQCTLETAERICGDLVRSGYVMDALTGDMKTQNRLRELIEQTGDLATSDI